MKLKCKVSHGDMSCANSWKVQDLAVAAGADKAHPRSKVSHGIIVCRKCPTTGVPQVLMVKARYSYAFANFVHGHYGGTDPSVILPLLSNMTIEERLLINTLVFDHMWYRIWLCIKPELYMKKKNKFMTLWMRDDGAALRGLLLRAQGSPPIQWGFPKGKPSGRYEPSVNCALREFKEETGLPYTSLSVMPGFRRQVSFTHLRIRYTTVLYMALMIRDLPLALRIKNMDQVSEVSDIRWMTLAQVQQLEADSPGRDLARTARAALSYWKKQQKE